jgi:signal transduction histidine kinase
MRHTFSVMFRPLRSASNEASDISPANLGARLSLKQMPSEILPLIVAFNAVLARLEAGFRLQQSFLETTAHELQTPLTLLRAQVEMAHQTGQIEPELLLGDLDTMSRRVRQLLHLAEVSEPQNYQPTQLDVANIAEDARQYLVERAHSAQVDTVIEGAALTGFEKTKVWGDEAALFMLLKNLIENAIKASPPLSVVTVEVATDYISVSDEGAGISAEHLPHIFERFWRAPHSREQGAGLGLSICQEIAAAHGWHLYVDMHVLHTRFVVAFDKTKHQLRGIAAT